MLTEVFLNISAVMLEICMQCEFKKLTENSNAFINPNQYRYVIFITSGFGFIQFFFINKKPEKKKFTNPPIQIFESESSDATKGLLGKMKKSNRRMVVFYGSQTGTAEEYATRLAKEGLQYGFGGIVVDLEDCNMEDLEELVYMEKDLGQN